MTTIKSPLDHEHNQAGARMTLFAGWMMPIQYSGILDEHKHTRNAASVFDISHMGELLITGKGCKDELSKLLTHDFSASTPGRCSYGFILSPTGTIMDDLIVYPLEDDKFILVVNASQKKEDLVHLQKNLSSKVKVTDMTMEMAKLDLQGPESIHVLESISNQNWRDLSYFHFRHASFCGQKILVSRTGYTGELGYELYIPVKGVEKVWQELLRDKRVKPAGLGARDTLRLEAGLPLYGQDLDLNHTPAEAGYEFVLKSASRYQGKGHALKISERLTGLTIKGRRTPRHSDRVFVHDKEAGIVTSGSFAPSLGHCIALAYIRREFESEENFTIRKGNVSLEAHKTELPFYKGTARIKL
ncbi:glycine cleavage system aminomethyltransferase GcvT [Desulfonatronovibrio magnus]|uniref:glycine cleavage system aminomethyltransferase GcvT n=1 Tax=Desulfonatronovibrio magnus TaxID=698827 RepID=UPI0005EB4C78|nr:glycine cleavage system aminomethyltransferase GcvT [Desulfonatronovibrio magnus]